MIYFKTKSEITIPLIAYGVSLNMESNLFTDNIYRSYSLPFTTEADEELLEKLGLPNLDNIVDPETQVPGFLVLPDTFYPANLFLGEIVGNRIECTITFGAEDLAVYDIPLKDLPWPTVLTPNIFSFANAVKEKSWPDTPFNFPMVYKPEISQKSDYNFFEGFINHHNGMGYLNNYVAELQPEDPEEEPVMEYHNRNVMAPFPYLLEILRFGYSLAGRELAGEAVKNDLLRKALYIPEKFLEKFSSSEYQAFSFTTPNETVTESGQHFGIYRRQFIPEKEGTYQLSFNLNLDPITARDFSLTIIQKDPTTEAETVHFSANSKRNRVLLEEDLSINITEHTVYDIILVELKIPFKPESIATNNQYEYSYKEGKLNEFPSYFSLSDFMPDMTFGEYVNELKNWLNLDVQLQDMRVEINFTQESIWTKAQEDHRHLEIPRPQKRHNTNRFYKLFYANDEKVFYNRHGQAYSELDLEGYDIVEIKMDVQPALVEQNENVITAVAPEEASGIDFCIYDGPINNRPLCSSESGLKLQNVFLNYWEQWLKYRVNSKTFKESFECSIHERININELSMKYNELHVIKKLNKKFISEKRMRVEVESETF